MGFNAWVRQIHRWLLDVPKTKNRLKLSHVDQTARESEVSKRYYSHPR